jgi:hypothetical protein
MLLGCAPDPTADHDFAHFWTDFRGAVLSGDRDAVVAMSRLPLEVRGTLDDEPPRLLDAAALHEALPDLLRQDAGLAASPRPMFQLVEGTPQPALPAPEAAGARVGTFEFALGPDGWRLIRAYVDR